MCAFVEVSRAGYYRYWRESVPAEKETALRDRLQELALAHRHYGYRRLGQHLRREGWAVNHKRVLRLLRGQSLVPAQEGVRAGDQRQPAWLDGLPEPGAPAGADRHQSALGGRRHRHPAGRGLRLSVGGAYSRRIVGWAIPEHLRASLALAALEMALASRVVIPGGLVHRLSLISCRSPSASAPSPALELTDKPASAARQNLTRASNPLQCDHERRKRRWRQPLGRDLIVPGYWIELAMRGRDRRTEGLFSYGTCESRVPADHPPRSILPIAAALAALSGEIQQLYALNRRLSIAPERLQRALLLQAFNSIRSERQLTERLDGSLLFHWSVELGVDEPVWNVNVFLKNLDRLLDGEIAATFFRRRGRDVPVRRVYSGRRRADPGLGVDEEFPAVGRQPQSSGAETQGQARPRWRCPFRSSSCCYRDDVGLWQAAQPHAACASRVCLRIKL